MYLNKTVVNSLLRSNGSQFVTVFFDGKDGEQRIYNGRCNIRKGLVQNERGRKQSRTLARHGLVPLLTREGYKAFRSDHVKELRLRGSVVKPSKG